MYLLTDGIPNRGQSAWASDITGRMYRPELYVFILAGTLIRNGTSGGMATPAEWHRQSVPGFLLECNPLRAAFRLVTYYSSQCYVCWECNAIDVPVFTGCRPMLQA